MGIDDWREKPMCARTTFVTEDSYDPVNGTLLRRGYSQRKLCVFERDEAGQCGVDAKFFSANDQQMTPKQAARPPAEPPQ
jgi:hypothetical protein